MQINDYLGGKLILSRNTIVMALENYYSVTGEGNYSFSGQGNRSSEISKTLKAKNFEIVFKSADDTGQDQKNIVTFFQRKGLFSLKDYGYDYDDIEFYTTSIDVSNTDITVYCRAVYPIHIKTQKQVLHTEVLTSNTFTKSQSFSPVGSFNGTYTAQVELEFSSPKYVEGEISFTYPLTSTQKETVTYTLQDDENAGNYGKRFIVDNYDEFVLGSGVTRIKTGIFKRFTTAETIDISARGFSGATLKIIKFSIQDI